jgi:hypothetical protein
MSEQHKLSEVSTEFLRPMELYSKLSTARLITGFYLENRLFEMQAYFMLLHRARLGLPISFREWQLKSRELELTDLEPLYNRCRDDLLVQLMIMLKIKWRWMLEELHKRFDPLGMNVLMEKWEDVERIWIQKRRLKFIFDDNGHSSTEQAMEAGDVSQQGMLKGLELLEQAGKSSLEEDAHRPFLELRRPSFPLPLDELERKAWDALLEESWSSSLQAAFGKVVPLLRGDAKSIGNRVDNFLNGARRKAKRRKQIVKGRDEFPETGPESWRAEWDFSRTASIARAGEIVAETNRRLFNPEEWLAAKQRDEAKSRHSDRAYAIAIKRSGKKGGVFLDALKEGKNVSDAATAAGINRRTATRIKEAIREALPKTE